MKCLLKKTFNKCKNLALHHEMIGGDFVKSSTKVVLSLSFTMEEHDIDKLANNYRFSPGKITVQFSLTNNSISNYQ